MDFKDYFSGHAADYAAYRPHYPAALFAWLAHQCAQHDLAWDCATGNGQAAIALTAHFQSVVATDGSAAQLSQAPAHPQVTYRVALAEDSQLPSHSVDLVTVAQATHWFKLEQFYAEVQRVLKPTGVLAIWCYGRPVLADPVLDALMAEYYSHTLEPFWAPERRLVETGYRTLPFPFQAVTAPGFAMDLEWPLARFMGYLSTWSATQNYIATHRTNPLAALAEKFEVAGAGDRLAITWPISLRIGQVSRG